MQNFDKQQLNYHRIEKAIHYLIEHANTHPGLDELSNHLNISKFHLQRIFTEWAGVSPKEFLHFITKEHAKHCLKNHSVLDTSLACGLSSTSRLHDIMISCVGATPGDIKNGGLNLKIEYGLHPSPFGYCFIANTQKGICKMSFLNHHQEMSLTIKELKKDWPYAKINENLPSTQNLINIIFNHQEEKSRHLALFIKGTAFQINVWEALMKIPFGEVHSYQELATSINKSSAHRAVASAIAKNDIAYLIPCHRVIRNSGIFNHYRWGATRKKIMLGHEAALLSISNHENIISNNGNASN